MDNLLVGAALLSAVLHAAWNAAVKAHPDPVRAMTVQMVGSALLAVPGLIWTGLPAAAAWPWMLASTLLNAGAVNALLRGYRHGGFGVVYPIARASSVLLVLPLAAVVAGELPRMLAIAGVGLVSLAMLLLASGKARAMTRPALGWTLAAGAFTAAYVVCDAQGARHAQSSLAYGCAAMIVNALVWAGLQRRAGAAPIAPRALWSRSMLIVLAAALSYLLILWVWTQAPIALAAALRDTSAIFAAVIAVAILKEPFDRRVFFAASIATAGAMLIRLQ